MKIMTLQPQSARHQRLGHVVAGHRDEQAAYQRCPACTASELAAGAMKLTSLPENLALLKSTQPPENSARAKETVPSENLAQKGARSV